uniref:Cytochrome c oxidase subunit 3 n=1 Tax=Decemunciger sp. AB-2017 TaxID=1980157 RepID=A0A1X9ZNS5_9ANNE
MMKNYPVRFKKSPHATISLDQSPWPLMGASSALGLTVGLAAWFHNNSKLCLSISVIFILLTMIYWWRDVIRESTYMGFHTSLVAHGLRLGMLLFILSEIMFFFGFFWAFFHSSLAPTLEIGCVWPPIGITPLNAFAIPLLNTAVLLASGVTVTWAHHSLLEGNRKNATQALFYTVTLGLYFTYLQMNEYLDASFSISDSIYGTTFFVSTGFHGAHVIIGTTFLMVCLFRTYHFHFSANHHFGFEAAAWYWHFVDVVWIFLYLCIYWWGS